MFCYLMLSHPCISGWWGVVRWKERTGFWVRLAGKCRGNTKEASVTFSSRIQIITNFQDIRIMMILGDLCRDDFWEIYAKMISRRFKYFFFLQEIQREEIYCRNRTSIHGQVNIIMIYNIIIIFIIVLHGFLKMFNNLNFKVSRDCFALQWFEDRLGCHGQTNVDYFNYLLFLRK